MASPHAVLGLSPTATKEQVKEAFRKLVWQYHPDKAAPDARPAAEAKFKEIKTAYESILQRQAGYRPPPPGSAPSAQYAQAYWHAHSRDGRVPWGQFAGHETELAFYRAMLKGGRNNMALLTVLGLLAIPAVAAGAAILQNAATESAASESTQAMELGLDSLRPEAYVVNGQLTSVNPFASHSLTASEDRYRKAQARLRARREAEAEAATGGGSE